MAKKDFSQVNNVIAQATVEPGKRKARKEYHGEEVREIQETLHTVGKKGCKLPRINLAFRPQVYEYIRTMSRVRGEDMTTFINKILTEHMEAHRDIYEKAIEFKNSL